MNQKIWELSLDGDTFNAMKTDFNLMLRRTLSTMERKESEQAEITIKLKINLTKDQTQDLDILAYDAKRDIIRPKFDHKVSSVMQYKDEASGTLGGNYELIWDKEHGDYVMREITNGQTSLFDNEDAYPKSGGQTEQLYLEGKKIAELPPAYDIVEADYREVDDGENPGEQDEDESQEDEYGSCEDGAGESEDYPYDEPREA